MRRYLQVICVTSVMLLSSAAYAGDAEKAEALARFNEGLTLVDNGKWDEARLKFLQSISLLKTASTYFNLASLEQKTGRDLDAIEHFRAFESLAATDSRITDQQRERAKQAIADLLKKVGQIDIRAEHGATVRIDGTALAAVPSQPVPVVAGRHVVEGSLNGVVRTAVVEPKAGEVAKAELQFADTAGAGTGAPPAEARTRSSWSTARIVTVAGLGAVAVTGVVLSIVFHSSAQGNVDDAKGLLNGGTCVGVTSENCTKARGLRDDRDSNVTLSTVSLIGGTAFAAGAVAAAIFWPKSKESNSARVVPMGAPGYGGIGVVGKF